MDRKLGGLAAVLAGALLVAGCATSTMQSYIGQDVRQVVIKRGPPVNAMDMGDGRRAFQWREDESVTLPSHASTIGSANSGWYTANTVISGGQTLTNTCIYTLYARWNEARQAWVVEGFEKPAWDCM